MRNLIKKNPKYSKRINYDALKDLFADSNNSRAQLDAISRDAALLVPGNVDLDDKEDDLYHIDADKSDGEGFASGAEVVEEVGGSVGMAKNIATHTGHGEEVRELGAASGQSEGEEAIDEDAEGEEYTEFDKGDEEFGWEEGYEQEV